MEETVVQFADGIYRHKGLKPKKHLFGAKLGRLVLTNKRLLFLSSGGSDVTQRLVGGMAARGRTETLDLSALQNEGSLSVPLQDLDHCEFVVKKFSNFLSIRFRNAQGLAEAFAFMDQFALPGGHSWSEQIELAKQRLRSR